MIPSDHFVRFYNEVFKFLDEKGGLQDYYEEISRHQDFHCLKDFKEKGLRGVYEYYLKIVKEENCGDAPMVLREHELCGMQTKCPSLTKAMDNDAGACQKYCLHCAGWTIGLYKRAGLFLVYDLIGLDKPQCCTWLYDDVELARAKYREILKNCNSPELIFINFEPENDGIRTDFFPTNSSPVSSGTAEGNGTAQHT